MKLSVFVKNECCNFVNNSCVGVGFSGTFNKTGLCYLFQSEKPTSCDYFKKCILPISHKKGYYDDIYNQYFLIDNTIKKDIIKNSKGVKNYVK